MTVAVWELSRRGYSYNTFDIGSGSGSIRFDSVSLRHFFWDGSPIRQTKAFDFDTQEKSVQHLGAMGWHGMGFITAFEHL
jgi:hypothetical protein